MAEPLGLDLTVGNAQQVERFVQRQKTEAKKAEDSANRAESTTKKTFGALARTGFTAVGNQVVAFAVQDALSQLVVDQTNNPALGFVSGVGTATAAGFAFGGFLGGAGGFLTGTISQIFGLIRRSSQEREELRKFIENEKKLRENNEKIFEERVREINRAFAEQLQEILRSTDKRALEIAQNGYQYA